MIVHKYYTDHFYLNSSFAQFAGLTIQEINLLEQEFLYLIDFKLSIDETEYTEYENSVN